MLYDCLVNDVERILSEENQPAPAAPALTALPPAAAAAAAPKQMTKTMSRTSRITAQPGLPPSSSEVKATDVKNQDVIKVDPLPLPLPHHYSGVIASYQPPKRLVSSRYSNAFLVYLRARGT